MKKTINVNGTNFTVDVNISAEDRYKSIESDYKKLLYLLGQVSTIGAKLDKDFTMRNALINKKADITKLHKGTKEELKEDLIQNVCLNVGPELKFSTYQKTNILDTIDSTMWWFDALKRQIESL